MKNKVLVDRLFESILHGNEIQFFYQNNQYYLLPCWEREKVYAVCWGKAHTENQVRCFSACELYNAEIDNLIFGKIVSNIDLTWSNFSW